MRFNKQKPIYFKKQKSNFSEKWIRKVFLWSFASCFCFFVVGKTITNLQNNNALILASSLSPAPDFKTFTSQPLIVNLKNKERPELTRIQVHIKTYKNSVKRELASESNLLRKQLLLILSGQDIKKIKKNKNDFEEKLVAQLNAFLSKGNIQSARIELMQ